MDENQTPSTTAQGSNKTMLLVGGFVVIVLLVLGGVYLMNQSKSEDKMASETTISPTVTDDSMEGTTEATGDAMMQDEAGTTESASDDTMMAEDEVTFNVTGQSFKFNPATITVKKGDTVKIVFKSVGGMHDFVVDEFDAHTKVVSDGQSDTITFVADKAGAYEYYCSVGNHRQMGMVGKLVVQ